MNATGLRINVRRYAYAEVFGGTAGGRTGRISVAPGFSLLETIVATALVAIILITSLNTLAFVLATTRHQTHSYQAARLAQALLAEISSQPFADPVNATQSLGRETDELTTTRSQWDDCDDYHAWSVSSITDRNGMSLAGSSGWTATVDVAYVMTEDPAAVSLSATPLKRITLTLVAPSGRAFEFASLRSERGTLEEPSAVVTNLLSHVDFAVKATGDPIAAGGTRVHNQQEPN